MPRKLTKGECTYSNTTTAAVSLLDSDPRLIAALGPTLSLEDLKIWAGMPETRRAAALQRIAVLDEYCARINDISAKSAAIKAGVTLGRFYQIARVWPEKRLLSSLGAYALVAKPRAGLKPHQKIALHDVVAQVIKADANQGDSIAELARKLGKASKLSVNDIPSKNTLRSFIEKELRQLRNTGLAGSEIVFDLSATSLRRYDNLPHVVFLAIDAGTGIILGHAIGCAKENALGYKSAASAALKTITEITGRKSIWARKFERCQMAIALDLPDMEKMSAQIKSRTGAMLFESAADVSHGHFIRQHLGLNLGLIRLMPSRTISTRALGNGLKGVVLDAATASARVGIAVEEHNAALISTLGLDGDADPPDELIEMLAMMAAI